MGSDVDGGVIREDLKGYTLRITGGNDKQGFAMKQGVLVNGRVRILLRASKFKPTKSWSPSIQPLRSATIDNFLHLAFNCWG